MQFALGNSTAKRGEAAKENPMITVKQIGTLHFLFLRDLCLKQCFNDRDWAKREAKRANKALEVARSHMNQSEAA